MNYLAHFTTTEDGRAANFTMIVDADNIEVAIEEFKNEIIRKKNDTDIFDGTKLIYLEDIIEIKQFPSEAQITRYESRTSVEYFGLIYTNPIISDGVTLYSWYPDDKEQSDDEIHPFLDFIESNN